MGNKRGRQGRNIQREGQQRQILYCPTIPSSNFETSYAATTGKIQIFSLAIFLKRGHINYQDLTLTGILILCSRIITLGKCFEGYTSEHCTIPDIWTKKVADKLCTKIQNAIQGQGGY